MLAALVLGLICIAVRSPDCFAADYYLHTTATDAINLNAPAASNEKYRDSSAINRATYQEIGSWSSASFIAPMQLESLSNLITWIGLKNSDDQGTYFDLKAEVRKNGTVIASGETKNIKGVTRNPSIDKEVDVGLGEFSKQQFDVGDAF